MSDSGARSLFFFPAEKLLLERAMYAEVTEEETCQLAQVRELVKKGIVAASNVQNEFEDHSNGNFVACLRLLMQIELKINAAAAGSDGSTQTNANVDCSIFYFEMRKLKASHLANMALFFKVRRITFLYCSVKHHMIATISNNRVIVTPFTITAVFRRPLTKLSAPKTASCPG